MTTETTASTNSITDKYCNCGSVMNYVYDEDLECWCWLCPECGRVIYVE